MRRFFFRSALAALLMITSSAHLSARSSTNNSSTVYLPFVAGGNSAMAPQASWGAPIAISVDGAWVWVVNPDADTVTVIETNPLTTSIKTTELVVGREPWAVALAPDHSRAYVLNRADGSLTVIDARQLANERTISVGAEPAAVALSPSGRTAFVTVSAGDELVMVDTQQLTVTQRIALAPRPYGIAISNDGDPDDSDESIYVTHLHAFPRPNGEEARDDGREARITVLSAGSLTQQKTVVLAPNANGFPNMLSGIGLQQGWAWVPTVRAMPDAPNTLTQVVFAAVSAIDTLRNSEDVSASLMLNDQDVFGSPVNDPIAAVPAPSGKMLFVVLAGSNLVEVVERPGQHTGSHPFEWGTGPVNYDEGLRLQSVFCDGQRCHVSIVG
jgi:YVTN family beta-propeller protein